MNARRDRFDLRERQAIPHIVDLPAVSGASATAGLWRVVSIDQVARTVTIGRGLVIDTMEAFPVAQTAVQVLGGTPDAPNYIFLRMEHNGTPVIYANSIGSIPTPTLTMYQHPLYEVCIDKGVVKVLTQLTFGVIVLPGLLGRFDT